MIFLLRGQSLCTFYLVTICRGTKHSLVTENNRQLEINIVGAASAASHSMQESKFSCRVFVLVETQRFGNANFSGGEMILIGQVFAVGSPGK